MTSHVSELVTYNVELSDGSTCSASFVWNTNRRGFRVQHENCSDDMRSFNSPQTVAYECIDSGPMFEHRDIIVVTRETRDTDVIRCWFLPAANEREAFMVDPQDCNEQLHHKHGRSQLQWLAHYVVRDVSIDEDNSREIPIIDLDPVTTTPTYPSSSRPPPLPSLPPLPPSVNSSLGNETFWGDDDEPEVTVTSVAVMAVLLITAAVQAMCGC